MRRRTLNAALCAAGAVILLGGCVPQSRYDSVVATNRSLQEQLVATEDERSAAESLVAQLRDERSRALEDRNAMEREKNQLAEEVQRLAGDYRSLQDRIDNLDFGPLPVDVERALTELADAHPNLISFDADRGMLRFASDLTFDLGSTEVRDAARQSLQTLAGILNNDSAAGLEAMVIGHTDNVPVSRPQTVQRHRNNITLSAHRAIAVRDVLAGEGVNGNRLMVAGWGAQRPVVPNRSGGTPENRRVEIFIRPMTGQPLPSDSGQPTQPAPMQARPSTDDPLK